ncbi:cbb3-type cytochrome oxidase assembly protein CcoS [Pusillimonas noertemannii]|nr:cbb3-type cytochrome oxidase assembly protein CcoS [Pusillimonas noertemannii]
MEAMFLLIAISLVFVVAIGVAFWWAIFAGQFDESDSAAKSILGDEENE